MKKYIRNSRYVMYDGQQIALGEGESKSQAVARYKDKLAKDEADRLAAEQAAKEEKEAKALARAERRKIPKYANGTIVLTKDGEYFQVYDGYYSEYDNDIAYDAVPCTKSGKWTTPLNDWVDLTIEIYQSDIQRKVK